MEMRVPGFKIALGEAINERILLNVGEVLSSGMFARGKYVGRVEKRISEITGARVTATSSGSMALEAIAHTMKAHWGLGKVLVPNNTFIATALAFERLGFEVDFYWNGVSTVGLWPDLPDGYDGLVIVDLGGDIPRNIQEIVAAAHSRGMWVVEDACQAFGSVIEDKLAGTFADMGAYSFFATKVLTSGEGGAVVTSHPKYGSTARLYLDFGKLEPWVSYHPERGWNGRMNELGAAALEAQLYYYNEILSSRAWIRNYYRESLAGTDKIDLPEVPMDSHSFNGYKVMIFLRGNVDKEKLRQHCEEQSVKLPGEVYRWQLQEQPVYQGRVVKHGDRLYDWKQMVCLPTYYGMSRAEIDHVVKTIKEAL